jgi:hypothetical protein
MDILTKKFNDACQELETRIKEDDTLAAIERIYGFVLGVVACMEALKHPNARYARENILQLLVDKRDRAFWRGATIVKIKELD